MGFIDMRESSVQPADLKTGRLLRLFALLSVIFVAVLGSAPLRPYFSEWRTIQKRYNTLAEKSGAPQIPIAVQQIWKPALGVTDRCVTCHIGMGTAQAVPGDPLFKAHPAIPHDPKQFGCTVCHGGQGRATTKDAAHGFVSFWDEQMLDAKHLSSGCGTCHNNAPWIPRQELVRGQRLIESLDCLSCHKLDGQGRGNASDLSYAGIKGFKAQWHEWHVEEQARQADAAWKNSYGSISDPDAAQISAYLHSRIGAPRVVEAQSLAMERGCLGCHKINGRGGDEGPALDEVGRKPVGDLNFAGVPGEKTLVNYIRRHFMDPAGVVPGSLMPPQAATTEEADLLTSYVLFLRSRKLPPEYTPKDRLKREMLGEARPALSGAQGFQALCSGCHGLHGEGRNYANLNLRFPGIGSPDFLDVASDAFIESTVKTGRPGRRMPALAASSGSVNEIELKAIVSYLRSLPSAPPSLVAVTSAGVDLDLGARTYRQDCAACHGQVGEGTALGSPLTTSDSKVFGKREALYHAIVNGVTDTAMPRYSRYDAKTLASVMHHISTLPRASGSRSAWKMGEGVAARGKDLYASRCAGCHGESGQGKIGPALANPAFLSAASTNYLAATVVRGRSNSPMPAFGRDNVSYPKLAASEVLDLAAYIRSLAEASKKK
jgi:mono/diheme cytochrome c family protein